MSAMHGHFSEAVFVNVGTQPENENLCCVLGLQTNPTNWICWCLLKQLPHDDAQTRSFPSSIELCNSLGSSWYPIVNGLRVNDHGSS